MVLPVRVRVEAPVMAVVAAVPAEEVQIQQEQAEIMVVAALAVMAEPVQGLQAVPEE